LGRGCFSTKTRFSLLCAYSKILGLGLLGFKVIDCFYWPFVLDMMSIVKTALLFILKRFLTSLIHKEEDFISDWFPWRCFCCGVILNFLLFRPV